MKKPFLIVLSMFFLLMSQIAAAQNNPLKALFERALISYKQGDTKTAVTLLEKTLEIYPKFAPSFYYLGVIHNESGKPAKEVISYFEKAVEADPSYAAAYENLGKLYYSLGDFDAAEENGLKALEIDPRLITAHLTLGWTYLLGKSLAPDAAYHFEQALAIQKIPYGELGLGMAYFMNGEKFKTLEMITDLKSKNEFELASQLEDMVRAGPQAQLRPGIPLFEPVKKEQSILVEDLPEVALPPPVNNEKIPVRLSAPLKDDTPVKPKPFAIQYPEASSAQERIRELQGNRPVQRKGSGN